jgi:hypothetical protein
MNENPNVNQDEELEQGDELDDAIINADDTGMVAQQHLIAEEEVLLGTEPAEEAEEEEQH